MIHLIPEVTFLWIGRSRLRDTAEQRIDFLLVGADNHIGYHTAEIVLDRKASDGEHLRYKRMWSRLMVACGCVTWREIKPGTSRPDDILKQVKPTLTPHYFRHNYVTLLYESGVDPLIAMKIVGHTDCQTTANIYMHLKEETLRRASVNMEKVFAEREKGEGEGVRG